MQEVYTRKSLVSFTVEFSLIRVAKYFRIGHMGVSVTDGGRKDLEKALEALESGLAEVGYNKH